MPRHHRGPHPPPHHGPPPPPHHGPPPDHDEWDRWAPPLPTDQDLALLEDILGNADEARSVFRILQSCPPEVSIAACLTVRLFQQMQIAFPERFQAKSEEQDN